MGTCPFCAEDLLEANAERCPSCGERLGELEPRPRGMPGWAIALLAFAAVVGLLCVVGGALSFYTLRLAPAPAAPPVPIAVTPFAPPAPLPPPPPGQASDAQVAALPSQTSPPASTGAGAAVGCTRYSWGGYGIVEVGRARVAVRGLTFSGGPSSSATIVVTASPSPFSSSGAAGSFGSGEGEFTYKTDDGFTTCTFGGQTFTIQDGVLALGAIELDTLGPPQTLLVNPDGGDPVVLVGP